jgi:hypothetical protein
MKVLFLAMIPLIFSFSLTNILSSALDFVPVIGNVKGLYESLSGKDMFTGEDLPNSERALSFVSILPFGNLFKSGKHFKNGQKFLKAAKRAQQAGKIKNAINFAKAGARAMGKAEAVQKTIKNGAKFLGAIMKQTEEKTKN